MSTFTTELRYMLETYNGNTSNGPASKVNEVIENTRTNLFDFNYPSSELTTSEKEHLEKHFMLHYYTREIGFETFGLFKMKLQSKLWDIMPKYEKLYALEHLNLDFFSDVDYTRKLDSTTDQDGTLSKMSGSVEHANSGTDTSVTTGSVADSGTNSNTNTTTGGYSDTNSGKITEVTSGSVDHTDDTDITNTKTGSIEDEIEFGKKISNSGSETDTHNVLSDIKGISGKIIRDIAFGKTSTNTGGYTDTNIYGKTDTTTGGYTDTQTGDRSNFHSDTPQSQITLSTAAADYITDVAKQVDNLSTQRTYNSQVNTAGGTDSTSRVYNNELNTEGGTQTETTTYGDGVTAPYVEDHSLSESNTKTFTNRETAESGTETKTTSYSNDYEEKSVTDGTKTDTYNDLTNEKTDTTATTRAYSNLQVSDSGANSNTKTYNNLTVQDTNLQKLTDTYNNLLNEIDKSDVVDLTERIYGNVHGNNIEKFIKYKDNILNIELMIIKDLNGLFMGLWA